MHVQVFCVNPFQTNCLVAHDGGEAVLIDPGTYSQTERRAVVEYIQREGLVLRRLLLTHGHIDHIFDLAYFTREFEMPYEMHEADLPLIANAETQARMYGLTLDPPPEPGGLLEEGDVIRFGSAEWEIVHTPGHSPGSVAFIDRANSMVISGDVLFNGSIGRTDLWKGSMNELMSSIFEKLMVLPDDYAVYCGHGPATTIGRERTANPFLQERKRGA